MLAGSANAQNICKNIIVDQFGYLPDSKKIAVIKNPITGFDSNQTYIPGNTFSVVNANTGERVLTAAPVAWNGGQTDLSSGDKVWQFDFSAVTANGRYYILDVSKNKVMYLIDCTDNQLTSLDVSRNLFLEELHCDRNKLTTLDLSHNTYLKGIWLTFMPSLSKVCVWKMPFPESIYLVETTGSPNIYYSTDCNK